MKPQQGYAEGILALVGLVVFICGHRLNKQRRRTKTRESHVPQRHNAAHVIVPSVLARQLDSLSPSLRGNLSNLHFRVLSLFGA